MSRAPRIAITVVSIAAATLCPASIASGAKQSAIRCGQVIVRDTTLRNDLVNCPGTGLKIGADGVRLNLNGHRVDGTNAPDSEGIAVKGHARVTIRNGTVRQFRVNGVGLHSAPRARVEGLTVRAIGAGGKEGEPVSGGIFAEGSDRVSIRGNRVSNRVDAYQADGIVVIGSKGAAVTGNVSSRNAWNGIVVVGSPRAQVKRNRTERNHNSGIFVADAARAVIAGNKSNLQRRQDTGGIVVLGSSGVTVVDNRTAGNGATGIGLELGTTATKVERNRVRGGGDGIALLDADGNTVMRNDVQGVGGVGIVLDGFGDAPTGSDDNKITRNSVSSSGLAGILIAGGSDGNALTDNVANASHGSGEGGDPAGGILIFDSTANRLDGNMTKGNATDGVRVATAGNTVATTTAVDNVRRGIEAVAGTIDGGGNHASGNGLEPQCTGVACS